MKRYLEFRWGTSRGIYTYGYSICSLYVDGRKVSSCNGGGYDMQGTALGEYITKTWPEELKTLRANYGTEDINAGLYGLVFMLNGKVLNRWENGASIHCNGACGFSSMGYILNALGFKLGYIPLRTKNTSAYILAEKDAAHA